MDAGLAAKGFSDPSIAVADVLFNSQLGLNKPGLWNINSYGKRVVGSIKSEEMNV